MSWIRITRAEDIPMREGRSVRIGGRDIAIFNLGGEFAAVDNRCPHGGGPLADGIVGGKGDSITVTCPLHNYRICLGSGCVVKPGASAHGALETFATRIDDGVVMLQLDAASAKAA